MKEEPCHRHGGQELAEEGRESYRLRELESEDRAKEDGLECQHDQECFGRPAVETGPEMMEETGGDRTRAYNCHDDRRIYFSHLIPDDRAARGMVRHFTRAVAEACLGEAADSSGASNAGWGT